MGYKLGLKLWSINTDYYLKEAIKLYNQGVYDYIELYVVPKTLDYLDKWKNLRTLATCGRGQGEVGIPFIIHCPHFAHGFNLAKSEKQENNQKIFKEVQKYADELDAQYIVIHGGIDGDIRETAIQLALLNEPRALIENKPFVALPNRMGGEFCRGYNIDEIKTVQELSECGFCFDFGHAICAANSIWNKNNPSPQPSPTKGEGEITPHPNPLPQRAREEYIYSYIEQFLKLNPQMFHLTDIEDITSVYDLHPHLGTGQLDIKRILEMIPDGKHITLETIKNSKENLDDFVSDTIVIRELENENSNFNR